MEEHIKTYFKTHRNHVKLTEAFTLFIYQGFFIRHIINYTLL